MLFGKMRSVLTGKKVWNKVRKKYDISNKYLVILRENEAELAREAINYLSEFLKKKYSPGAIVLTTDNSVSDKNANIVAITQKEEKGILSYFSMYPFYDKVIVVSLEEPFGSYGMLNKEGITMEAMIRDYIFI